MSRDARTVFYVCRNYKDCDYTIETIPRTLCIIKKHADVRRFIFVEIKKIDYTIETIPRTLRII
jgi:ssDNA-binding Zn-finger/Zn-ribbon topoisomerase 1